jgi:hypothetical protein
MKGSRLAQWIAPGLLLSGAVAQAALLSASGVQDFTVIQDGRGSARILFRAGPAVAGLTNTSISHASLTFTTAGTPDTRRLRLRIYPVTTAWSALGVSWTTGWNRAGGDYDEEIFTAADLDLSSGTATAVFDVTGILKEVLESGMTADGFILTVDPVGGVGVSVADLTRFGTLGTASFDVRYRNVPPGRLSR